MKHCKDCKYWLPIPDADWEGGDTGHGNCDLLSSSDGKVNSGGQAYVLDGEHYSAVLYSKPEFGCTLGEGR